MTQKKELQINDEQLFQELQKYTDFNISDRKYLRMLNFDASEGVFKRQTDEVDDEGKPIYEGIGEELNVHLITARKMIVSSFQSKLGLYSREFKGNGIIKIYDQSRQVVMEGLYEDLKLEQPQLEFVIILYLYYEGEYYRMKLSRSKLVNFFPYLKIFGKNTNPAMFETELSKGELRKKGANKYYLLDFKKGERIENKIIIERVKFVNEYLAVYQTKKVEAEVIPSQKSPLDESILDDIPFNN